VTVGPDDFKTKDYRICPGADPTAISQSEKLMKAQGLLELLGAGLPLDPLQVTLRVLEAQEQPNMEQILPQAVRESGQMPPPPPDPKMLEMQMKGQLEQQKMQMQGAAQQQKMELEARSEQTKLAMKQQEHAMDMQHAQEMNTVKTAEAVHKQAIFEAQSRQQLQQKSVEGQQKLVQNDQAHQQKLKQAAAQPKPKATKK
jgi:hypothetical protein